MTVTREDIIACVEKAMREEPDLPWDTLDLDRLIGEVIEDHEGHEDTLGR